MGAYFPQEELVIVAPDRLRGMEEAFGKPIEATAAPARPGHIAEREELDAALAAGTAAALELFIERHPNSRYRAEAETALGRLRNQSPSR